MSQRIVDPAGPGTDTLFAGGGETGAVMAGHDWAATSVGPPATWSGGLRNVVRILLTSRFPMWLGWGPELAFFYNDAYRRDTLAAKHPWALGRPAREVWAEVWAEVGPRVESVLATGVATWDEDLQLFLERSGYPEETYHTFSYSPLDDADGTGRVDGLMCVVAENTEQVLSARRTATLRELSAAVAGCRTTDEVVAATGACLAGNAHDVPFALLYRFADAPATGDAPGTPILAGATGIDRAAPAAAATAWPVDRLRAGETVLVGDLAARFADLPTGAWDRPPSAAVAVSLGPGPGRAPMAPGFLVVGLNPFRRFDDGYRGFVELVAAQVSAALGNAAAYQAQERRADELAELDRAKTAFFSNVSHEFRTPLTLMLGPVAQLRDAPAVAGDARLAEELAVVHRNGLRLQKLVNSLLDFSRLEAGRAQPRFEALDLSAVTAELTELFRTATDSAGLTLDVRCLPLPAPVRVDRDMWEKVVLNLLSNAVKFTFTGGVTVSLLGGEGGATLEVTDTGIGIPDAEAGLLFQRFHQVRGARGRSAEGSGIGLALAKELVELHGGTIEVRSVEGSGTTFTVRIPSGPEAPEGIAGGVGAGAQPYVAEALRWITPRPVPVPVPVLAPDPPPAVAGAMVLVADDNADIREYVTRLLADTYEVIAVADGTAALRAARARPPDLVVSDVMMPGLDGLGLLAALRADPMTAAVPVMLVSARAGEDAALDGLARGADDYLVKPFTAAELLTRVAARVELGRARRAAERRFRGLADATPTMIWVDGPGAERVLVNRAWTQFVGAAHAETDLGSVWRSRIHPDDRERYATARRTAESVEGPFELEYRLRRDDGRYCWVLDRGAPFLLDGDGPTGYVGGCLDIDDRYRERERERLFAVVGTAMSRETTVSARRASLVRTLVDERVVDTARLLEVDDAADDARVVAVAATLPEQEDILRELSGWWPLAREVHESGQARTVTVDEAYLAASSPDPAQRELHRRLDMRSVALVPLTTRGRVVGLLATARSGSSLGQDAADLALLVEIGERAATALDNAALLSRERETSDRLTVLQEATGALSAAATPGDVADVAVAQFGALLGADVVGLWVLHPDRPEALDALRDQGFGRHGWVTVPTPADNPLADAVRARESVWVHGTPHWDERYPHLAEVAAVTPTIGCVPLVVGSRCVGAVAVGFAVERRLTPAEHTSVTAMADQCAQALDRAGLLVAERAARRSAEDLAGVVAALSGATTMAQVTAVILDHAMSLGAAAAAIVLQEGEHLQVVAATDATRRGARLAVDAAHPLAEAVRTAAPVWQGPDRAGGGLPGRLAVPLLLGGVAIGAFGMAFDGDPPELSGAERSTLRTVAGQYAQALDRARLYQVEHEVADVLQRSLLPGRLPDVARIDAAARYLPGTLDTQAGGDWYDLVELDEDRVALVVGDVVGHGPPAAAVMGKLSAAVTAYLLDGHSPAAALERLDRFASRIPAATGSTCVCLTLDWRTGDMVWAGAGHLPLLLIGADGSRFAEGGSGTVLGVRGRPPYQEGHTTIAPGTSVAAYTDGLVERRGEVVDEGLDALAAIATAVRDRPSAAIADDIVAGLLADSAPVDDVALVVVRRVPEPLVGRLPAHPRVLAELRSQIAGWARGAGLPVEQLDDLQLAVGEAAANAAEHAYPDGGGEFEFRVERTGSGGAAATVRDHGTWRTPPVDPGFRGRGLQLIRAIGEDVTVDHPGDGTKVWLVVHPPAFTPDPRPASEAGGEPVVLTVTTDLDLAGVEQLRPALTDALAHHREVTLDLRRVRYLSSAGVGLLTDATHRAAATRSRLTVRVTAGSQAARILEVTRQSAVLPVVTT